MRRSSVLSWTVNIPLIRSSPDTFLVGTRMFHFSALTVSVCCPADPGPYTTVFINNEKLGLELGAWTLEQLEQLIVEHKPTAMMIPYHYTVRLCHQSQDLHNMKSVKVIVPAGARVGELIEKDLKSKIPGVFLSNVYGSIETGGAVAGSLTQANVGFLYPNNRVKVRDLDTGRACGPGEIGEICVYNDKLLLGYLGRDNKDVFDSDGFYRMGDVGKYDKDGCLHFIDRVKDLMDVDGHKFYPIIVESVLDSHEEVLQVSGDFRCLSEP